MKSLNNLAQSPFIILLLLNFVSCTDAGKLHFNANELQAPALKEDFATFKAEILKPMCLDCHAWAETEEGLKPYITVGDAERSTLYKVLRDGSMPLNRPALSSIQLELVEKYINALRTPTTPPPSPAPNGDTETPEDRITFQMISDEILTPRCLGCHSWANSEDETRNLFSAGEPENSPLYIRVADGSMPPFGGPLSDEEIAKIKQYILDFK